MKVILAFPNTYKVGITSLGYQIIWATLAKRKDVDVRRLFTDKAEKQHRNCHLFGLSLSWELDGPVLLDLLEKQNIPIWSHQRKDSDPIVFGGGPVLTANPEPLAPFLDVVLLGDGEELLSNFINRIKEIRQNSRSTQLIEIAQIPGAYVPSLYTPQYNADGSLIAIKPIENKIPPIITKQTWMSNKLSHSSVITPEAAWPNIHMVEVVRSCPELCRFCLASYLNLPFRSHSLEDGLIPAVEKGLKITKRIGLLGASVSQHPQFNDLLQWLSKDYFDDIHLSLSSVRASTVTLEMTRLLSSRGSKSITIAIESGSKRIRDLINKKLTEEEIYLAAKYASEGGLKGLKLYGMVGLPEETNTDIEATGDLLLKLKETNRALRLTLGLSTFVPKAHTPFQWHGVYKDAKKRIRLLTKKLKSKGIDVRAESFGDSLIQALLSRSDRRIAPVIDAIRRYDNSIGSWKQTYTRIRDNNLENYINEQKHLPKLPPWNEIIYDNWHTSRILPWNHLQGPLRKEKLIEHRQSALNSLDS